MAIWEYLGAGSWTTKGLYHLNGGATDSSGNWNNGAPTSVIWVWGKIGSWAASFNGSSSYINMGNVMDETWANPFTMSCWINFSSVSANQMIMWKQLSSWSFWWYMLWGQRLEIPWRFFLNFSLVSNDWTFWAIEVITPDNELSTGTWYNVCATYDWSKGASWAKIYINWQLKSSTAINTFWGKSCSNSANFNIGSRNSWNLPLSWIMDECIKENREWTATEVQKQYTYALWRFGIL